MTPTQTAWLAGLFEGEGCISFTGKSSVILQLNGTDEDVVRRCYEVSGVGHVNGPYTANAPHGKKPVWCWSVSRRSDILMLLEAFTPLLGLRRNAKAALAIRRIREAEVFRGERGVSCMRGHDLTGYNLYRSSGGHTQCRECANWRKREKLARLRLERQLLTLAQG